MMKNSKNKLFVAISVVVVAALTATLLPMLAASGSDDIREIRLVVRDMTFYVEGESQPNPTLNVHAGEQVRLVLKNEDPGLRHDFVVSDWQVATRILVDRGEQDTITFRVPAQTGDRVYHCTPHSKMMRGTLRVQ